MKYTVTFIRIDDEANETITELNYGTQHQALNTIAAVYEHMILGTKADVEQKVEGHYVVKIVEHFNK